jgi:hypothetical protein
MGIDGLSGPQGHSAKNDRSTEVLRSFCTRETFLRGVPDGSRKPAELLYNKLHVLKYVRVPIVIPSFHVALAFPPVHQSVRQSFPGRVLKRVWS